MFYRLHCTLASPTKDAANDVLQEVLHQFHRFVTINPGTEHAEPSTYRLEKCYHDKSPSKPCVTITSGTT